MGELSVVKSTRNVKGSCSACNDNHTVTVYELNIGHMLVRVCRSCALDLIEQLKLRMSA
jgi:hypothetical protein